MGRIVFGMMQSLDGYVAGSSGGPHATLVSDDVGGGKPYFSGPRPPLHLVGTESVGEDAVRLTYAT